ncbi:MAG TPA: TonB-dependent receptor [Gemmatimonadaceae bacterium]|nr:TonB-dependent receptor [Gemmatimonadaceae bacterium]
MHSRLFVGRGASAFIIAALAVALNPLSLTAQATGQLTGRVMTADSSPIVGAFISIDDAAPVTQSDVAGTFRVDALPVGNHVVHVRRSGYVESADSITVASTAPVELIVSLAPKVATLAGVTVIGSRTDLAERREQLAQIPGGVAMVETPQIRATRQANLKDVLQFVPGVYIQPRFGAADESQISIRGSGLRDNFHARGVNLLVNGMPYRNADGFTDFESLELLTTESIEVYKGGNALRYGGSTLGGAINLDTKTGYSSAPVALFGEGGSFGFYKTQLESGGTRGASDYYASYGRTSLDGYRQWSGTRRDRVNLHSGYRLSDNTDARAFYFFAHVKEELPGSLDRATFESNPRAADPNNVTNRWGRDYDLHHLGLQLRTQLSANQRLEISPYMQYRDIDHPIFEVISQISHDYGAEVRYENTARVSALDNRFTLGFQPAYESLLNKQYQNNMGEHGALTKDQHDRATTYALYAEDVLALTPQFSAVLGLRGERASRETRDFFLSNGDQSDKRTYSPISPKIGFIYSLRSDIAQIFGNASRSYEPPLLLELNSLTVPGYIPLEGQSAWQYELGARGRRLGFSWDLSGYDVELKNEILNINVQPFPGAQFTVPTYRNSPQTRHSGIEAGLSYQLPGAVFVRGEVADHLTLRTSYTLARYTFVSDPDYEGNDIPGAPQQVMSTELKYTHPSGFSLAPSVEWIPQSYFLDSQNTVKNDGWTNLSLRADWATQYGMTLFAAGQNLANRRFSQSAQVDNAAGKYYEPADGRSFYAGLRWSPR